MASWTQKTISTGKLIYNNSKNKLHAIEAAQHFGPWRPALLVRNYNQQTESNQPNNKSGGVNKYQDRLNRLVDLLDQTDNELYRLSCRVERIQKDISMNCSPLGDMTVELEATNKKLMKLYDNIKEVEEDDD